LKKEIEQEIQALRNLKTKALKVRYRELFGEESRSSNHTHLFRRIAWRLQALAEGELSERARHRASELASDVDLRLRAPLTFWRDLEESREAKSCAGRDPRVPLAGTTLERKYRGKTVSVKVLEDGFEYEGRRYESLSSIASSVTGTRWNGFSFFGLNKEVQGG
jgi:Protein of unknown function (DUF2924)